MKLDLSCYRMYDTCTIQLILSVIYVAYSNYFYTLHQKRDVTNQNVRLIGVLCQLEQI